MIAAFHSLIYSDDPDATRAFFRDVLELPHVDTGGGWLIFKTGPSELGVHPTSNTEGSDTESSDHGAGGERYAPNGLMEFSLAVHDIDAAVAELTAKGAEFTRPVRDDGFGLTTAMVVPGTGASIMVYQARYQLPALLD